MDLHTVAIVEADGANRTGMEVGRTIYYGNSHPATDSKYEIIGYQGAGVMDGSLIRTNAALERSLRNVASEPALLRMVSEASGSFAIQVQDRDTGTLYFLTDPLGGGMILHYQMDHTFAWAVDINSLRTALAHINIHLAREPYFELARLATGSECYGADTPFKSVEALAPGTGIAISEGGEVRTLYYGLSEIRNRYSEASYAELVEVGISHVRNNIAAIMASGDKSNIVADITGGFDSRLLLAFLAASQAQDSVTLTSISGSAEWPFAMDLAGFTGFDLTDQRFTSSSPMRPNTLVEHSIQGARASGSIIDRSIDPLSPRSDLVSLQGGYGETFRTFSKFFYTKTTTESLMDLPRGMWAWQRLYRAEVDGEPLFTEDFRGELSRRFLRFAFRGLDEGVDYDYLSNYSYLHSRNRYWIGQHSFWRSQIQPRLDPLYSPHLILAAEKLPFRERRANFVGLDVLSSVWPELLTVPFFNKGVLTPEWIESRGEVSVRPYTGAPPARPTLAEPRKSLMRRAGANAPASAEDVQQAKRLKVPAAHVSDVRTLGGLARETIQNDPVLSRCLNQKAIGALLRTAPVTPQYFDLSRRIIGTLVRGGSLPIQHQSADDQFMFGDSANYGK